MSVFTFNNFKNSQIFLWENSLQCSGILFLYEVVATIFLNPYFSLRSFEREFASLLSANEVDVFVFSLKIKSLLSLIDVAVLLKGLTTIYAIF